METAAFEKGATIAEKRLAQAQKNFEKLGNRIGDIGKSMSVAITAPVAAAGAAVIKMSGDFEAGMNRVAISTQGTAAEMKAMSDLALQIGKDTTFGATDAANAMDMLAKNGLAAKDILDGAATAAVNLAQAGGAELAPAADAITDVMQQFKKTSKDLPGVVDQITGAVNESKLDFEDFANAIGQAGGVAGSSGVEFEDFNAAIAATSSLFSSGADAGTSFKTFITQLTPNSKPAANAIEDLGLRFFDAAGNMRSMSEIAEELRTKLGGLSEADRTATLKTIFGTDAMRTAIGLMDQGAAGIDKIKAKIAETDAAAQSAKRLEGFNGQLENLKGAVETLAIRIGQSGVLEAVTGLVTRLAAFVDTLSQTNPAILKWVAIVAGIAAVVGPVLIGIGALVSAAGTLLPIFTALAAGGGVAGFFVTLAGALPPVAAGAAAVYIAFKNWDEIKARVAPLIDDLGSIAEALGLVGQQAEENGKKVEKSGFEKLSEGVSTASSWLQKLADDWDAYNARTAKAARDNHTTIQDGFRQIWQAFGEFHAWLQSLGDRVRTAFASMANGAIASISRMVAGVSAWLKKLGDPFQWVAEKLTWIGKLFFQLYDKVVGHSYIPDMVDEIGQNMARLQGLMVDPAEKTTRKAGEAFRALAADVSSLMARLFPEFARLQAMKDDLATIDAGQKAGILSADTAEAARQRARRDAAGLPMGGILAPVSDKVTDTAPVIDTSGLEAAMEKVYKATGILTEKTKTQTVQIAESFKDMTEKSISALQGMVSAIKGGGFLDILSSAVNLFLQLASTGLFGSKIATRVNTPIAGARANGGPVSAGKAYLVGERGPELVVPRHNGTVISNDNLKGGGRGGNVYHFTGNLMTPEFWAQIDAGDAAAAQGGAGLAQSRMAFNRKRTIGG